ncbi:MAG: DUF4936 domain-containing protein [Proteobacteria bacterium]|nr:MAG: DUF4936 domain-containing protein [Pseudomonadota bacterium]
MSDSYYVYYRVRSQSQAAARAAVNDLLARVSRDTGVRGRLQTKRGEPQLWMEIYEAVESPEKFELALREHVKALHLEQYLIDGHRHVECFQPCV